MSTARVAVVELTSNDDFSRNLDKVVEWVEKGCDEGAELICFPENSLYFRCREDDQFAGFTLGDPVFDPILHLAKDRDVTIHLGGIPLNENDQIFNASVVVDTKGYVVTYRKTHLFDIALKGRESASESAYFTHGDRYANWQWRDWNIGQTICFDVRFPEVFRYCVDHGAEAFTVPAAFIVTTGRAHWELLVRTRAVETQSWVLAAAQEGRHEGIHGGSKESWGHSMIVNPWGDVVALSTPDNPMILAEIDKSQVHDLREQVPLKMHRNSCRVRP